MCTNTFETIDTSDLNEISGGAGFPIPWGYTPYRATSVHPRPGMYVPSYPQANGFRYQGVFSSGGSANSLR